MARLAGDTHFLSGREPTACADCRVFMDGVSRNLGTGEARFDVLPPLGSRHSFYPGAFDARHTPTVDVCERVESNRANLVATMTTVGISYRMVREALHR